MSGPSVVEWVVDPSNWRRESKRIQLGSKLLCGRNQAFRNFVHPGIIAAMRKQKHPADRQGVLRFFLLVRIGMI